LETHARTHDTRQKQCSNKRLQQEQKQKQTQKQQRAIQSHLVSSCLTTTTLGSLDSDPLLYSHRIALPSPSPPTTTSSSTAATIMDE
jgi:hypothetical protein